MTASIGRRASMPAWLVILVVQAPRGAAAQPLTAPAVPQHAAKEKTPARASAFDRDFQSAVASYEAKNYERAQKQLEPLVGRLPDNFDVNELMGLVYAAEGQDAKANRFLVTAVRLKPDSAAARTNLAVNLARLGRNALAESEFKKAAQLEPDSFDSNHNLGEFYVRAGNLPAAIPYLKRAQIADPSSYANGYDLALACGERLDPASLDGDSTGRRDPAAIARDVCDQLVVQRLEPRRARAIHVP